MSRKTVTYDVSGLQEMVGNTREVMEDHYTRFIEKGRLGRGFSKEESLHVEWVELLAKYEAYQGLYQDYEKAASTLRHIASTLDFPDIMYDTWKTVLKLYQHQLWEAHQAIMSAIVDFVAAHPGINEDRVEGVA